MTEIKLTELEAIQLTIEKGFKGEELDSAIWKKNGALDGKRDKVTGEFKERNMVKFIRKLETLYHHVSVEGKGKKRIYTLSDAKEIQSQMQDDRKFNGWDNNDYVMCKHVFNRLIEMDDSSIKSAYEWAINCNAFKPSRISKEMIRVHFHDLYYDEDTQYIFDDFQKYIKNNNSNMIKKAFKYLKHKNLIKVTDHYSAIKLDNQSVEIDKDTYYLFTSSKDAIFKKYDVSAYSYKYFENNEKYAEMFEELEQLYDEMKMELVYVSHSVQLLNRDTFHEINTRDFFNSYYSQLLMKINKLKHKKKSFITLQTSFRIHNLLSTLSIVIKDNERLNQLIESKRPEQLAVDLILLERHQKGIKVSDSFLQQLDEMEFLLSGTTIPKKEEVKVAEIPSTPITIDDIIDFNSIENGIILNDQHTYLPLDDMVSECNNSTYRNNKELASAVEMIKLA